MNKYKINYPGYLDLLSDIFAANGHVLYIVGGFVRDAVLGRISDDIDLCSDMTPDKVVKMLECEDEFAVAQSNLPLGTIIIRHKGVSLEYTAFRRESYRRDGTHTPEEVFFDATIADDALRRDFTCNALYYDIGKGELLDFFDGISDIDSRVLKAVRAPEDVFSEDALRILRMARIAAEILFRPEEGTLAAAKGLAGTLGSLSTERIAAEMQRLMISDAKYSGSGKINIKTGMEVLFESGAAGILFPGTRFEKSLVCTEAVSYSVKAALFLYKCTDIDLSLDCICPNGEIKKDVIFLMGHSEHDDGRALGLLLEHGYRKGKLLEEMMRVLGKRHTSLSKYLKNMEQPDYIISMKTLDISGKDIKDALDIPDSPKIGRIKKELLEHIIEHPEDNKKEKLVRYIKNAVPPML